MVEYFVSTSSRGTEFIVRPNNDGSVTWIPESQGNADWQAYQEWLAEGNTPEPWPPAE